MKAIPDPELNLLLSCVRTAWNPNESERLRRLLAARIDWPRCQRLAATHRVAALAYRCLHGLRDERIPATVLADLHRHFLANIQFNMLLSMELDAILKSFQAQGILAIPFKGLVLAGELYDPPELRPSGDLDMIVAPEQVDKAMNLLTEQGFRSELDALGLNTAQIKAYRKVSHGFHFLHEERRVNLDLHWNFANRFQDLPLSFQRIAHNRRTLVAPPYEFPTLAPQDMIQYLCYHGQENHWTQLTWISDIAGFLQRHRDLDWNAILEESASLNNRRRLMLGLWITHELLDSPLPDAVRSRLDERRRIPAQAGLIYDGLLRRARQSDQTSRRSRLADIYLLIRLAPGWRGKLRAILEPVYWPRPADFLAMPLPVPLFPLYFLLRPLRLIGKYCSALWSGGK